MRNPEGRKPEELRPVTLEPHVNRYAEGSVLIKSGNTHVLCTASVQQSVPKWMEGKGKGWISAEYSMLPRATHTRSQRDREKISGRTQEIQRLIGRALRSAVDMSALGERSIIIDCDVLQADGGTRTASITGGCTALALALHKLEKEGSKPTGPAPVVFSKIWNQSVSAISLGIRGSEILVDLDYDEDFSCDVDMNFVMTGTGDLIEVQGTAEGRTFSAQTLGELTKKALQAGQRLNQIQKEMLSPQGVKI